MAHTERECPVCGEQNAVVHVALHELAFECPRCGGYVMHDDVAHALHGDIGNEGNLTTRQKANLSGWLRERPGVKIEVKPPVGTESKDRRVDTDDVMRVVQELKSIRTPTLAERARKLLVHLSEKYVNPGTNILSSEVLRGSPSMLAVAWAEDTRELKYLLYEYLHAEKGYVTSPANTSSFRITPRGWAYLESITLGNPQSQTAFVAMWYHQTTNSLWTDGIAPGIVSAGYTPERIDRTEHVNRIDDEIVAGIRRSKFVVADFTGSRGGVYFEAGYALGLGLPVIWTCRKDDLEKGELHFDVEHFNFLTWTDAPDGLRTFSRALTKRIEALPALGHGPVGGRPI